MGGALRRSAVLATALALVLAAPAQASDSVAYQANPQHTGAVSESIAPPLAIKWSWDLGGARRFRGKAGSFSATLTGRLKVARHYAICTRERRPDAWGRSTKVDKTCGARRIRLP